MVLKGRIITTILQQHVRLQFNPLAFLPASPTPDIWPAILQKFFDQTTTRQNASNNWEEMVLLIQHVLYYHDNGRGFQILGTAMNQTSIDNCKWWACAGLLPQHPIEHYYMKQHAIAKNHEQLTRYTCILF